MKILYYLPRNTHFGPDKPTSIDLCVHDLIQNSRYKDETTVVCSEIANVFDALNVRTIDRRATPKSQAFSAIIKDETPDIIIVQQHGPTAEQVAALYPHIPVILQRHNFEATKLWQRLRLWRHRKRYEKLAGIVLVSDACKHQFENLFPTLSTPLHTVYNGLDTAEFSPARTREKTILVIGRIEQHKNVLDAAKGLRLALAEKEGWTGMFIGERTGDKAYLQQFDQEIAASPNLTCIDHVPFEQVKSLLQQASGLVMTSRGESFGRVIIEAFAAGAGVVATRNGALSEIVGDAGILLDGTSELEIANAVEQLIQNRAHYAEKGLERAKHYDIKRSAEQMDDILQGTLVPTIQRS